MTTLLGLTIAGVCGVGMVLMLVYGLCRAAVESSEEVREQQQALWIEANRGRRVSSECGERVESVR